MLRVLPGNRRTQALVGPRSSDISAKRPTVDARGSFRRYDSGGVSDSDARPAPSTTDRILEHADSLYNLARYLTGNSGGAEDLVQETFIRALKAAPNLGDQPSFKPWLFRILRNVFYDTHRSGRHDRATTTLDDDEVATPDAWLRGDAELELLRGRVGREIQAAMSKLGEESRTVVLLDVEGFTETEIANIMDCPVGTVKSRLMRARSSLRKLLSHYAK